MVAALARGGKNIDATEALDCVYGYGVGLDMTQRDLQSEAKKAGRPWDVAKGFDNSAPCGELVPVEEAGHPGSGVIALSVNGDVRQSGDLRQMIWSLPEIIAILSRSFALGPGDLIMTGTPAGVGRVVAGDVIEAQIEGVGELRVTVLPAN